MADSDNHAYNVPQQGAQDWHIPLNENFEDFDTDIELRDSDGNKGNYDPKQGAKFLATDTGVIYEGDGTNWVPTLAQSRVTEASTAGNADNLVAGHPSNSVGNNVDGATIAGGGFDDGNTTEPNVVDAIFGTVGGGRNNRVQVQDSTIAGGQNNLALGETATVAGGSGNTADAGVAIGGGNDNTARGSNGTIAGGFNNNVARYAGSVGGGELNTIEADFGTIGGGGPSDTTDATTKDNTKNVIYDNYGTIGGGGGNVAGTDDGDATNTPFATVAGGKNNTASGGQSTIAGGKNNSATNTESTVGGGANNDVTGSWATISGGIGNTASGTFATVPGGIDNTSAGRAAVATGESAEAAHDNAFVWADGSGSGSFSSSDAPNGSGVTGSRTFNVKASNGVKFVNGAGTTYIPSGSTGWTATSTRAAKTNIQTVNPLEALDGVRSLEIASWEYRNGNGDTSGTTHIGPMAEDFHAAFDCGDSDEHINSINADGVAFAAIQGLAQCLDAKDERIDDLEAQVDAQADELAVLREELADVSERL